MTIGPEPMTRTDFRSVRRAIRRPARTRPRRPAGRRWSGRPRPRRTAARAGWAAWHAGPRRGGRPGCDRPPGRRRRARTRGWRRRSCAHQLAEGREEAVGVVRAGRGLGVVLDAERAAVEQPQPLDDAVVEVDVGDLGAA